MGGGDDYPESPQTGTKDNAMLHTQDGPFVPDASYSATCEDGHLQLPTLYRPRDAPHKQTQIARTHQASKQSIRKNMSLQTRKLLAELQSAVATDDLHKAYPLAFLDKVSTLTTSVFRHEGHAIVYDKLTLLPLLFHKQKVLLVINVNGPRGWKPPSKTFNAASIGFSPSTANADSELNKAAEPATLIRQTNLASTLEGTLLDTLALRKGDVQMSLAPSVHEPCFGALRIQQGPQHRSVDGWILAQIFELGHEIVAGMEGIQLTGALAGAVAGGGDGVGSSFLGGRFGVAEESEWPIWKGNEASMKYMKWFGEGEASMSAEIDEITKEVLRQAFEAWRDHEGKMRKAMEEMERDFGGC